MRLYKYVMLKNIKYLFICIEYAFDYLFLLKSKTKNDFLLNINRTFRKEKNQDFSLTKFLNFYCLKKAKEQLIQNNQTEF